MPDPSFLYIVSAVVVIALVVWVIAVRLRAPLRAEAPAKPPPKNPDDAARSNTSGTPGPRPPSSPSDAGGELRSSRSRLNSHLEIQDEPGEDK